MVYPWPLGTPGGDDYSTLRGVFLLEHEDRVDLPNELHARIAKAASKFLAQ